jgi:CO/xanthine dehydrogenase FAD-binding subunit
MKAKQSSPKNLLDLSGLSELRYIERENARIRIGALTTIADLEQESGNPAWPKILDHAVAKFGSPNIRSVATVGGNICAAASSEDLIPVFLALDSKVKAIRRNGARELGLEDFVIAKRKTALAPDEILAEITFPELSPRASSSFQKLGMRNILIIAVVSVAAFLEADDTHSRIASARIALNRFRRRIPERAENVEKWLLNQKFGEQTIETAVNMLGKDLTLTSDTRASAEYRSEAAKVLLRRALGDCQQEILKR